MATDVSKRLQLNRGGGATALLLRDFGQRERGPHESFSLVSPYSLCPKPRGDPSHSGKRNPVPGWERNSEPTLLFGGRLTCMTPRSGYLYFGFSRY
jgi:hypothetical protein